MYHEAYQNLQKYTDIFINVDNKIKAYFTEMAKLTDVPCSEYLHIVHSLKGLTDLKIEPKDRGINLEDFLPEPKSLYQVQRMPPHTNEKWGRQ